MIRGYRTLGAEAHDFLFDFFSKQASSANAFLTLYRDYKHFEWSNGRESALLSYVDTPTAWIGAADPVGSADLWISLVEAFSKAAREKGKEAIILPVSKPLAEQLIARGHFAAQIGSEPWLRFGSSRNRSDLLRALPAARQLSHRGARVDEFSPAHISADEHSDLEMLNQKWLQSRRSIPLGFLNRLDPWALMQYKKYFRLTFEGQPYAYLAAVPIPARNAWYLVDLIRDPEAPTGTTELLLIEAMATLEREGASEVTLGMSPLVPVQGDERKRHPLLYKILELVYKKGDLFYSFQSLRNYKDKFAPNEWQPLYVVAASPMTTWRSWYGLFRAIYPQGIVSTTVKSIGHWFSKLSLKPLIQHFLSNKVMSRPLPLTLRESASRLKVTVSLIAANLLFYFLTVNHRGNIRPFMRNHYVYSWDHLFHANTWLDSVLTLFLPGVLHWNAFHLAFNLVLLFIAVGFTEILAGSALACGAYLAGSIFSNVITSLILYPIIHLFHPAGVTAFLQEPDIGCSLGIFGCIGAVTHLSRHPRSMAAIVIFASIVGCFVTGVTLELNHIVAFVIGYEVAKSLVK